MRPAPPSPILWVVLAALLPLAACDTASTVLVPPDGPDPLALDYDTVESLSYEDYVRPLLAARAVLGPSDPAAYSHEAVLMAGPSGFVVPFDSEGSLLLRFLRDLPESAEIPFPRLRNLEPDERRYLARWIEDGARDADGMPGFHGTHHALLAGVQGENHIAMIDAETLRLIRRIDFDDLGIASAPYGPHHFAFEPDGSAAYVSLVSAGVVAKVSLDLTQDPSDPATLLGRTSDEFATPGMLSLDPSSDRIFVGRSTLSDPLANGFGILDRETMAMEIIATPFNVPHAMASTPDGRFAVTAELTGTQAQSRALVYDTETGDASILVIPADGAPREFIHFSILGAHHAGMMGHSGMPMVGYPYTVTLTSRSTDEVLFLSLAEDGTLAVTGSAPAGDGPYHAHANHDGSRLLIPDQRGDTVTILDADGGALVRTVDQHAPGGPLSQPHSPAPSFDGSRFFVTSSNLDGAWTPLFPFRAAGGAVQGPEKFGNVAAFSATGEVLGVVQLGAYPSGLEPVMLHGSMDHEGMDHGPMDHEGMDHGSMDHGDH